jgi:hypothetical protein
VACTATHPVSAYNLRSPCEGTIRLVALSGSDHALGQPFMRVAVISFRVCVI